MIYLMSDVHGNFTKYSQAINALNLTDADALYLLGDVVDRGHSGIKILQDMAKRNHVIPILGNHDFSAYSILKILAREITEDSLKQLGEEFLQAAGAWLADGGEPTLKEFRTLSKEEQKDVLKYIKSFELFEEIRCNGKEYILTHAGFSPKNFDPQKDLYDYELYELISARTDYNKLYWADKILVTGHTPVQSITDGKSDKIYKKNNHIAIDCGCGFGGPLAVLCLDTMEEMYF